jgi:hypothetical protein
MNTKRFHITFAPLRVVGLRPYVMFAVNHNDGGMSMYDSMTIEELEQLITEAQNAKWDIEAKQLEEE